MYSSGIPKVGAAGAALTASLIMLAPLGANAANVALTGVASQSSDYSAQNVASKAIDGNVSGYWPDGSIASTNNDAGAWWQLQLTGITAISEIVVFNRTDCCGERLGPFNMEVLLGANVVQAFENQAFVADVTGPYIAGMTFDVGVLGDGVRIQLVGTNYLSLAEVVVNGTQVPPLSTPLPAAVWLMGSAMAGLGTLARRRKQR